MQLSGSASQSPAGAPLPKLHGCCAKAAILKRLRRSYLSFQRNTATVPRDRIGVSDMSNYLFLKNDDFQILSLLWARYV